MTQNLPRTCPSMCKPSYDSILISSPLTWRISKSSGLGSCEARCMSSWTDSAPRCNSTALLARWSSPNPSSMSSASKPLQTLKVVRVMWSYLHRRESTDTSLGAEDRIIHYINSTSEQDLDLLLECLQQVKNHEKSTCIVHTAIPLYRPFLNGPDMHTNEKIQNNTRVIEIINQLDCARDGHHFDRVTADWVVEQVVPQLRL